MTAEMGFVCVRMTSFITYFVLFLSYWLEIDKWYPLSAHLLHPSYQFTTTQLLFKIENLAAVGETSVCGVTFPGHDLLGGKEFISHRTLYSVTSQYFLKTMC